MNKQELIKKIRKRLQKENPARIEQLYCEFIRNLSELEQTKVEMPEFVAEWIEQCKARGRSLLKSLLYTPEKVNSWVDNSENQELFACACFFGYTVEKEKRYFVKIRATKHYFTKDGNGRIFFSLAYKSCFTKAELEKAGFCWVFNCTGIEILEVEDE